MAVVVLHFDTNTQEALGYAHNDRGIDSPVTAINSSPDLNQATKEFEAARKEHGFKGKNEVIRIVQSWSPEDSKKISAEQVNQMGVELVSERFKGYQIHVGTHLNTKCYHNHIVINSVSKETGMRTLNRNPGKLLQELRNKNDSIAIANGLSVPNKEAKERQANLPEDVKQIVRRQRQSYLIDMMQKADFAKKYATSYDHYAGILENFDVQVRVENKNISYLYPGMTKWKRGSKLGKGYDKKALEENFKKNDELFSKNPTAKDQMQMEMNHLRNRKEHPHQNLSEIIYGKDSSQLETQKDYGKFTPKSRVGREGFHPSIEALGGIIPMEDLKRARASSIIDYCQKNKIALTRNKKDELVLKNKEYISIADTEWVNKKGSHTRGNLIDFVAIHEKTTFLQAVAKINGNPGLLELEKKFGKHERTFTPFYVPKQEQASATQSLKQIGSFLKSHGANPDLSEHLVKSKMIQVDKKGLVHLFEEGGQNGSLDFVNSEKENWSKVKRGTFKNPFFTNATSKKRAALYIDPNHALKKLGVDIFRNDEHGEGILVLMEPNEKIVDKYLSHNHHVRKIDFVFPHGKPLSGHDLDFFNNLKKRYRDAGISIELVTHDNTRTKGGPDLSI